MNRLDFNLILGGIGIVDSTAKEIFCMREGILETANGKIWYSVYGGSQQNIPILILRGGPGFMSMSDGLESLEKNVSS
jgi:hypothetical protein